MSWLTSLCSPRETRGRFIAVPHAGGWPSAFNSWRESVPEQVELLAVNLPGRAGNPALPVNVGIGGLADRIADEIETLPVVPTALFGHSFGGLVAYEVARRMAGGTDSVPRLAVSGIQAPCVLAASQFSGQGPETELVERLVFIGGLDPRLAERGSVAEELLVHVRTDLARMSHYVRPPTVCAVPILGLVGSEDPVVRAEQVSLWSVETSERFDIMVHPGGHFAVYDTGIGEAVMRRMLCREADRW